MPADRATAQHCRCHLLPAISWLNLFAFFLLNAFAVTYVPQLVHATDLATDQKPGPGQGKKILVLSSNGYSQPTYQKLNPALLLEMKKGGVGTSDLFFEYLDLPLVQERQQRQMLADMLRAKYAKKKIDLVVTLHSPAIDFLLNEGRDVVPEIPVVHWTLHETFHHEDPTKRIFHTSVSPDVKGTLERALAIFPATKRVVVITGASEMDKRAEAEARQVLAQWENKLHFEYIANSSVEEILARVADLPSQSIVIYYHVFQDSTGRSFIPSDVGEMIVKVVNAPLFCLYDTHMERGMVGGSLVSFQEEGSRIGRIALDILSGKIIHTNEEPDLFGEHKAVFDWQLIKKWGGNVDNLPEGTVLLYPPFSLWSYKWHIIGVIVILLAQLLLIGALLAERRRRGRAEEELRVINKTLEQRVADRVEQLQKEEARYQSLFTSMTEGFAVHEIIFDVDGKPVDYRFLEINPAFEKLTGLSREMVIGKTAGQVMPELDLHWIKIYSQVALEGTAVNFENYSTPLNRWYEGAAYRNNPGRFVVIFNDITERKRAEIALRESENRLNRAQAIAHLGSWEVDLTRNEMICSDEAYRILGLEPNAFAATYEAFLEHVHPDERAAFNESYMRSFQSGQDSFEMEHRIIRRNDGAIRYISQKCQHVRNEDGRVIRSQGMVLDITERKQSEEKLRQLAYIPEEDPNPMLRCSPDGRTMYTNVPANQWLLTFDRQDDDPAFLPEGIREVVVDACRHDHPIEVEITNPAGHTFGIFAIQPPGESYVNLYVIDLTIRKRALMALEQSNQELANQLRKIEELNRNLQAANKMLEEKHLEAETAQKQLLHTEKLAAIGKLSASIAHEFNNPLQSIMTILKGIGQYADLKEKEGKLVNLAIQECRRIGNLIANLQDFYRPTTGRIEPVDLHAVFDDLLLMTKKDFNTRRITVVKEYAADLPAIDAVSDQLKQVFLNLLNNAADACDGGGRITITTETFGKEKVAVHVKDDGVGIDPANIGQIFEPFFTTKRSNKGTGLGLPVSYGIIKKHGGQIDVKSEVGKGTVFSVFLPVKGIIATDSAV